MTRNAAEIARLITLATKDIVRDVDGYYYYWPTTQGHLAAWMLRTIADELDRMNKPWDDEIAAHFASREAPK